ncbi:MAG: tRNA dihydrouridine synthase DusB [Myxococcales bacterium FL481]|nr:MAG: tRNA dihydrouridine synthase DusB [Myxococcales bacterium FL481]
MAGVTNWPFRSLCRRYGAGLYVSEMITARPLVEGNAKTLKLAGFGAEESPRSLQLYGVDPHYVGEAVARLVGEGAVDHIDMNFGCPVPKVTRRGGGSAIPARPKLLRRIVAAAVANAGDVPVTIKVRKGIDDGLLTFLESGRIASGEGCAAIGLHARTAAQLYDGEADWDAIAQLRQAVEGIPVLGNGDIWEAEDALRMMRTTGCDGVIVGRGCLGRPWLFRDLADVFAGRAPNNPPCFGAVAELMMEHAQRLTAWMGEVAGLRSFRKHAAWYSKGFHGSAALRAKLMQVSTRAELRTTLATIDPSLAFAPSAMRVKRGKTAGRQKVMLPDGFLDARDDDAVPRGADDLVDGG